MSDLWCLDNLGENYFLAFTVIRKFSSDIKDLWPRGTGTIALIANFLWNSFADSYGKLFMNRMTFLSGNLGTLLLRLVPANLVRNIPAHLSGNISARLFRNIIAHWVGHLPLLGFGHLLALIVGIVLASSRDGNPDLVVPVTLPLVLAVLLVQGGALGLGVRLVLRLVLVHTHVLVDGCTLLLIDGVALLSGGGLTLPLKHSLADVVMHSHTLLGLLLLVLGVPDGGVLRPALYTSLFGWSTYRRLNTGAIG